MSMDNHTDINSVSVEASAELARKNHGLDGTLLLLTTSNYGAGAGIAPDGNYMGFIVGSSGVTISSITYNIPEKHSTYSTETINSLGLVPGIYYPLDGIKTITITAGAILLYKQGKY